MDNDLIAQIVNEDTLPIVIMGGIALVWIVLASTAGVIKSNARERTKREIAAYIAEGSMSPEQGDKILRAGPRDRCG